MAAARATAMETAKVALAPRFPLLSVPSVSISSLSISTWFKPFLPVNASLIFVFTLFTAFCTPRPKYLVWASRSSTASNLPVLAPEGTDAFPAYLFPVMVSVRVIFASTVGFPRESKISRPQIPVICIVLFISAPIPRLVALNKYKDKNSICIVTTKRTCYTIAVLILLLGPNACRL